MNRGIARRAIFEDLACVRYFSSRLAREVRRGELEVHAFVFMTTHYHMLLRSPNGGLSESMRFLQNMYVRWFNRRYRRDGPLFRGRFISRLVDGLRYRRTLVRYIDQNPVSARLVDSPANFPHGSACRYATDAGPPWLARDWVEEDARQRTGALEYSALIYRRAFGSPVGPAEAGLVEARIEHPSVEPDPLDDLIRAAPEYVANWMLRKADLADGTQPGLPCASAQSVHDAWALASAARPKWTLPRGKKRVSAWEVLLVGLLRDVGGLRWSEICARVEVGESTTRRRHRAHGEWMVAMGEYRAVAGEVAARCFDGV